MKDKLYFSISNTGNTVYVRHYLFRFLLKQYCGKKRPENVRKVLSKHNPFSIVDGN